MQIKNRIDELLFCGEEIRGMRKNAIISEDKVYRYALARLWDSTKMIIMWLMLNPSTADGEKDDNTISRLIAFTKSWGFGGFVVGNFYAFRCTDSAELFKDKEIDYIGPDNMRYLFALAARVDRIIVAPGNLVVKEHYDSVLPIIAYTVPSVKFYCLKQTKKGFPNHPLYLKSGLSPKRLDVQPADVVDIVISPSTGGHVFSGETPASWEELNAAGKSVDHYTKNDIEEFRGILEGQQASIAALQGIVEELRVKVGELKSVIQAGKLAP